MSLAKLRQRAEESGDHETYRSIVDKGVEQIQKVTEETAGTYGFNPQTLGAFKVRLKGVLNQERIHG
jgi:hypothetical protein